MLFRSRSICHQKNQKAFFYIDNPDELNSFDDALKNINSEVVMLMVSGDGELDDNNANSYIDEINIQLYILQRKRNSLAIADLFKQTKDITLSVLARTKVDFRGNEKSRFRIEKTPYHKVGPMNEDWYGYYTLITFLCPFGFKVDSGNWLDKE